MDFHTLLTDNATLTDAALGFYTLANDYKISPTILPNWLKFLENSVLYDEIVADSNVFDTQAWTLQLKQTFDYIKGFEIDSTLRQKINSEANLRIADLDNSKFDDIKNNQVRSNVKRTLFYLGLSNEIGTTYSPSSYRNSLLESIASFYKLEDSSSQLEAKMLENVMQSAKQYAENVKAASGVEMVIAELPPVSSLVINYALRCGSWSEAIFEIKEKEGAKHFKSWAEDVTENLKTANNAALKKLERVNSFIKGWGTGTNDGLEFKVHFGIASIFNLLKVPLKMDDLTYSFRNPLAEKHVVFLNESFKAAVSATDNWNKLKNISM